MTVNTDAILMLSKILYGCFLILSLIWAMGYYVLHATPYIHLALLAALIAVVISVVKSKGKAKE